jgi:hypothetical protein
MKKSSYSLYFVLFSLITLFLFYLVTLNPILNYDSDRIYNLRAVPEKYRSSLLEYFLDKRYKEGSVLLLGDSQVYGHEHLTENVFSSLLANKLNKKVINVAFQDSRMLDNIHALEYAIRNNMEFDTIVYNVNLVHAKRPEFGRLDTKNPVDFRFGILGDSQAFYEFKDKMTPQQTYHDRFYEYPVTPTRYKIIDSQYSIYIENLNKLIRLAKSISKDVIIYITPNDGADVIRREFNMSNLEIFAKDVNIACKKYGALCLQPNITARENYFDTLHFTLKGHRVMADLLFAVISRGSTAVP